MICQMIFGFTYGFVTNNELILENLDTIEIFTRTFVTLPENIQKRALIVKLFVVKVRFL